MIYLVLGLLLTVIGCVIQLKNIILLGIIFVASFFIILLLKKPLAVLELKMILRNKKLTNEEKNKEILKLANRGNLAAAKYIEKLVEQIEKEQP